MFECSAHTQHCVSKFSDNFQQSSTMRRDKKRRAKQCEEDEIVRNAKYLCKKYVAYAVVLSLSTTVGRSNQELLFVSQSKLH